MADAVAPAPSSTPVAKPSPTPHPTPAKAFTALQPALAAPLPASGRSVS